MGGHMVTTAGRCNCIDHHIIADAYDLSRVSQLTMNESRDDLYWSDCARKRSARVSNKWLAIMNAIFGWHYSQLFAV